MLDIMDRVMESVATTGGASINIVSGATPVSGFMVSRAGSEVVIDGELTRGDLEAFAQAYHDELDYPSAYLGVWTDEDTGLTYLDVSDGVDDFDFALMLGYERGQVAIYDVERERVVSVL